MTSTESMAPFFMTSDAQALAKVTTEAILCVGRGNLTVGVQDKDLLAYEEERVRLRHAILDELVQEAQELGLYD